MFDYVEISFILVYPTTEFWFLYFMFSCAVLPIPVFDMYLSSIRAKVFPRKHIAPFLLVCFLSPLVSVASIYGIYKRLKQQPTGKG